MKKYINTAFIYAIAAIACGVFYREFTKFNMFEGKTTLAFTHLHFFALGTLVFYWLLYSVRLQMLHSKKLLNRFLSFTISDCRLWL